MIARSTPWGTIQLGEEFTLLSEREQAAVLAHEHGHIHHRHALKRLWWMLTFRACFNWKGFLAMCEAQELEADSYAVECGHAPGLIQFLLNSAPRTKVDGYPTIHERLGNIHVRRI
jgi:Peptidase family M48